MTLNDKEVQELQGMIKKELGATEGTVFQIPNTTKLFIDKIVQLKQWQLYYFVDNEKGVNPNYQETTIVVAGTQMPFENSKEFENQPYN